MFSSRSFTFFCLFSLTALGQALEGDGHLMSVGGRPVLLVGDSGTHCVMQNSNINYRAWIDDCADAGMNAIHVWSIVAPRQTQEGKTVEKRYGYVYPGITPWARRSGGPLARDGLPQWDLRQFDEGDDPSRQYWPRMRDLCQYAKQKNLLVGITVFFGWPKHGRDWVWHPFNTANGGHLTDEKLFVTAVQIIATPGREMLERPWSDAWSDAQKTQWLWERFAVKLLKETQSIGNTFYIFMDERSYSEGNCGDHFAKFFRRRNAFWIDGQFRRDLVDGVVEGHGSGRDVNRYARRSFEVKPHRPFFEFELTPYQGAGVRHNLYACLLGVGHLFFHNDERQETVSTGIMGYDPNVKNSRRDAVRERQRWLGIACRLLNGRLAELGEMAPANEVIQKGEGYCLALLGQEYIAYIKSGGQAVLRLVGVTADYEVTVVNPRTGQQIKPSAIAKGSELHVKFPDEMDWVVLAQRRSASLPKPNTEPRRVKN